MAEQSFGEYTTNEFEHDPLFLSRNFRLFGDPEQSDGPIVFYSLQYRYLLSKQSLAINQDFCFKAACYIYFHWEKTSSKPLIFFLGDVNRCNEIAKQFQNQTIQIVSLEMIEQWYPRTPTQISKLFVKFLFERQSHFGQKFSETDFDFYFLTFSPRFLQEEERDENRKFVMDYLQKNGLVTKEAKLDEPLSWCLTEKGMDLADEEERPEANKDAFIAIKFDDNLDRIKAIESAISSCGYHPVIMTELQTNDWIMPEIFHQIKQCRFLVADFSLPCDGAYYEAGYGLALGKDVIHLYDSREKDHNPLHFDIAQKSTIMYKDLDELTRKLTDRIRATIN